MRQGPLAVLALALLAPGTAGAELPERYRYVLSEGWENPLEAPGLAAMLEGGDFAGAQALAERLLAAAERDWGSGSLVSARLLDLVVEIAWDLRREHDAATRERAMRALGIKEQLLAPDDPRLARGLKTYGNLLIQDENFAGAKPFLERAVAIMEGRHGYDDPAIERYVNSIGLLHLGLGEFEEARAAFQRALELKKRLLPADHPEVADVAYNLAIAHQDLGEYTKAGELYREVLEIKRRHLGAGHPTIPFFMNGLATLLWEEEEYGEARALLQEAIDTTVRSVGAADLQVATLRNNFGVLLRDFGDLDAARFHLEEAQRIREELLSTDHPLVAQTLYNLGRLFQATGDAARARDHLLRARTIHERAHGSRHPAVGTILHDLGRIALDDGHDAEARRYFEQSLEILKASGLSGHPDVARCLNGLGLIDWRAGAPAVARDRLEQSLRKLLASVGDRHPLVARARLNLGLLLAQTGDRRGALDHALLAEDISRENLAVQTRLLPEQSALNYASIRVSGLDLALSIAQTDPGIAPAGRLWDAVIRSREVVLDSVARRNRLAVGRKDPETRVLLDDLRDVTSGLSRLLYDPGALPPGKDYSSSVADLRERKQRIESRIAARSREFHRTLTIREVGFRDVAAAVGPMEALVSFAAFRRIPLDAKTGWWSVQDRPGTLPVGEPPPASRYVAFVLRHGADRPLIIPIADAAALDGLVHEWTRRQVAAGMTASGPDARAAVEGAEVGRALRRIVWDSLRQAIAGADRILMTPDGILNSVSFYALVGDDGRYLIEDGPLIHYLSAERDLLLEATSNRDGGLLAMGDVDYLAPDVAVPGGAIPGAAGAATAVPAAIRDPGTLVCPALRAGSLPRLPHTRAEVEFIADAWSRFAGPKSTPPLLLTKRAATEAAFKTLSPGRRILHLAAHGFFLDSTCPDGTRPQWRGIGQLSPASGAAAIPRDPWSPLLLSGVVLAATPAGDRAESNAGTRTSGGEDGFLTSEEISSLDLDDTDWVVLSACDTGRGRFQRGEGILGLRRAFHIAGVRTLITSLWPVDDEAASQWMIALYRGHLEKGLTAAEAVRAAGLQVLNDRRSRGLPDHPFFWAGWIAEGAWR